MSTVSETFDPYLDWLGIDSSERPANHYRLLGIDLFASDPSLIAAAADARMAFVRSFQTGPRGFAVSRLLNELSAARLCLLSPSAKAQYDAALQARIVEAGRWQGTPPPPLHSEPPLAEPPPIRRPLSRQEEVVLAPPIAGTEESGQSGASRLRIIFAVVIVSVLLAASAWAIGRGYWQSPSSAQQLAGSDSPASAVNENTAAEPIPAAPTAIVLMQEGTGEVSFTPATALLSGGLELQPTGLDNVLVQWRDANDAAQWKFRLVRPGFFEAEIEYATVARATTPTLLLQVGEKTKRCELRGSDGLDRTATDSFTILTTESGEHTLVLRLAGPIPAESFLLKSIRLKPVGGESGL